ncbi:MAG: hypothetical protein JNM72_09995 [Deltaproteobacteria bacterium]|nr:hypothetical protein [Deltaproteobacteria bacterium]
MHTTLPPGPASSSAAFGARRLTPALALGLAAAVALAGWLDLVRASSRGCRLALLPPSGAAAVLALPAYRASPRDAWSYGRCVGPDADLAGGLKACAALGDPLQSPCVEGVSAHLRPEHADPAVAAPVLAAAPRWAREAAGPQLARLWTVAAEGEGAPVVAALGLAGVPLEAALRGARAGLPWQPADGATRLDQLVESWPEDAHPALLEEAGARAGRADGATATVALIALKTAHHGPFVRGVARGAVGAAIQGDPRLDGPAVKAALVALSRAAPGEGHELRWGAARAVLASKLDPAGQRAVVKAAGLDELERQVRAAAALPPWMGLEELAAAGDAMIPRQMPTILR